MGKRKDSKETDVASEEHSFGESPTSSHKKHKKHKKKHKKKREEDNSTLSTSSHSSPLKPSIKLKLKIGGETLATKDLTAVDNTQRIVETDEDAVVNVTDEPWEDEAEPTFPVKKPGEDTSDEEREWLDALEKGKLDEYGEMKKHKDPSLMTARQRALLEGKQEKPVLQALPSGYKIVQLTEEQLLKRQQRAKKRKQQAHEKAEKDKKQTLDRLLKKQEAKMKGSKQKSGKRSGTLYIHYSNKSTGVTISTPQGIHFPYAAQGPKRLPGPKERCGVEGCCNEKKYACSKTGVPLCSLECYKKNLLLSQV